jgi:hypothetical protein
MNILTSKLKENSKSIAFLVIFVLIINFFIIPLGIPLLIRFVLSSILVIIGLTLFLVGIELGITPFGLATGSYLAKTNKLFIIIIAGVALGFIISIAEPGLILFANQVDLITNSQITSSSIIVSVSFGLALLIALGFIRIIYNLPLYKILLVLYILIFLLAFFVQKEFISISFDASGATTGVLAVPFLLSLSVGISKLKKDSKQSEKDSFGMVAIASTGAVFSLMILSLFSNNLNFLGETSEFEYYGNEIFKPFIHLIPISFSNSLLALFPLIAVFILMQVFFIKLNKKTFIRLFKGFIYATIGLFVFLLGINSSYMEVGHKIGFSLRELDNYTILLIVSFILGFLTIISEPAVFILTNQIEEITSGYIKKTLVLIPLALGVGLAILLAVLKILYNQIELTHYLIPGYFISLALMFIVPKLFVGIAFDAGGVATGPLTATFILSFMTGVSDANGSTNLVLDSFGMIALVALTPIITLQILGFIYKLKSVKGGI